MQEDLNQNFILISGKIVLKINLHDFYILFKPVLHPSGILFQQRNKNGEHVLDAQQTTSKDIWDQLLESGGYSIGYFAIPTNGDRVRVYNYRSKHLAYFNKETSFQGMQSLCHHLGYDFPDLLKRHTPKSFRSLQLN